MASDTPRQAYTNRKVRTKQVLAAGLLVQEQVYTSGLFSFHSVSASS